MGITSCLGTRDSFLNLICERKRESLQRANLLALIKTTCDHQTPSPLIVDSIPYQEDVYKRMLGKNKQRGHIDQIFAPFT